MTPKAKPPMIFPGVFSGRWYVTQHYEDRGDGTFICTGEKYDITDQINAIIEKHAATEEYADDE